MHLAAPFRRGPGYVLSLVVVIVVLLVCPGQAEAGVNTSWTFPKPAYTKLTQRIQVVKSGPHQFWAAYFPLAPDAGYMGLQTGTFLPGGGRGRVAVFSIWNANGASGAGCTAFSHEGSGYGCRIAYPWVEGYKYEFRLTRGASSSAGTWWSVDVARVGTLTVDRIGSIRARPGTGAVGSLIDFTEYFGPLPSAMSRLQQVEAVFEIPIGYTASGASKPATYAGHNLYHGDFQNGRHYVEWIQVRHKNGWTDRDATPISASYSGQVWTCGGARIPLYSTGLTWTAYGWLPTNGTPVRYVDKDEVFTTQPLTSSVMDAVYYDGTAYLASQSHLCAY